MVNLPNSSGCDVAIIAAFVNGKKTHTHMYLVAHIASGKGSLQMLVTSPVAKHASHLC